jgi:hypothetical protein
MVAILDHQLPPPNRRPRPNLCLHCGAQTVERKQVQLVPTPRATETWTPIPHLELVTQVERTLKSNGLVVGTQAHSLTRDGARYFGLMEVQREEFDEDYCWVLGLRNSHDKTFPAGIVAGAQTFVCDNLSFSGEVKLTRKHTRFITRDLPSIVQSAIGKLMDRWHHQDTRLSVYKLTEIEDCTAHDLIVRATDVGVCPNKLVPRVLREWREPRHDAFTPRNAWSLFNAFTEALKGNLIELPRRTEALHGLLDTHVGLHSPS